MTDYGIKVSNDGVDVKTGDVEDMTLHSEHYGIKIVAQGSASFLVSSGSGGSTTVAHGLAYAPAFLALRKCLGEVRFSTPHAGITRGIMRNLLLHQILLI